MKSRNVFNYAAGTALLFSLIMTWACGSSGGANSANLSKVNNSNSIAVNKSSDNSSENVNAKEDTTPLTVTISEVFNGGEEKFKGRRLTVTNGLLMDIDLTQIRIKESSWDSKVIVCHGSFTEYMELSRRVKQLADEGKPLKVEIKGVYIAGSTGVKPYTEFEPCVISDLKK